MKLTIKTERFNDINDIELKNGYDATWCDYITYTPSEISERTEYTGEQLEQSPALCAVLERAINRATEQAVADAYYTEQSAGYETYIERLESMLNESVANSCEHGKIEGKISLSLTEKPDCEGCSGVITIEGSAKTLALMTIEIINGEGMFRYDTISDFATVLNGRYSPSKAVESHLHYLLNMKLICDIWGDRYSTVSELIDDRAISGAYPEDSMIKEAIEYELDDAKNDTELQDELLAIKYVK